MSMLLPVPESILLAKKFLQNNMSMLRETERRFQVDKEIIVAILLVESRFGENIGKRRVIPTLASIALIDLPENLQYTYQVFLGVHSELAYDVAEGLAKRRAQWAYQELRQFSRLFATREWIRWRSKVLMQGLSDAPVSSLQL